jgi:hypothetical protein
MIKVHVASNWTWPDLMRQTPGGRGVWANVQFTLERVEVCDYVVILNQVLQPFEVQCPPRHIWTIMQEPPTQSHKRMHRGAAVAHRVYTQDADLQGRRYIHSQPALPWHVNKSYDYLTDHDPPKKTRLLSWITSNKSLSEGHRVRLRFLEKLQGQIDFDLYGRGFRYIEDKWDGLASYRYSIAVENFQNPYYWSEKIADCFLAWTMPVYFGCTRIDAYFPSEAMVHIDIGDPTAVERIKEAISGDLWQERLEAIAEARELVLNHHQLFPFLVREIEAFEASELASTSTPRSIVVSNRMRLRDLIVTLPNRLQQARFLRIRRRIYSSMQNLRALWRK